MTLENLEKMKSAIESGKYQETLDKIDALIEVEKKQVRKLHQLKLSLVEHQLALSHDNEHWADKMNPEKARKLFQEYLVLYESAFGKQFDDYNPKTKSYHFENWKARMMWNHRKIVGRKNDS